MRLQMRKVIEQSLDYLNEHILSIPFSNLKLKRNISHYSSLSEVHDFEYKP